MDVQTLDFHKNNMYKGPLFPYTNILDTQKFQKPQNLYHYTSNHPKPLYKAIITGELIRYIRTNTREEQFTAMARLFEDRLLARDYPKPLIHKTEAQVSYKNRNRYLQSQCTPPPKFYPPLYKYTPPPQYQTLKEIVLQSYGPLQRIVTAPRFISLRHRTLRHEFVRSKLTTTDEQFVDICLAIEDNATSTQVESG